MSPSADSTPYLQPPLKELVEKIESLTKATERANCVQAWLTGALIFFTAVQAAGILAANNLWPF